MRPFYAYANDVRRINHTTNSIELLNFSLRKVTMARGHFPNDEAALKLAYLAIRNMEGIVSRFAYRITWGGT